MRITFVINATPPSAEKVRAEVARLRAAGHTVEPRPTFEAGDARRIAREGAEGGSELIVSVGGDGTLNEAVNGLHDYQVADSGRTAPRLAVIPLGTANDFAGALGLPTDITAAMNLALSGATVEMDVALVNDRCFINVSTGGFGAEATDETSDDAKAALGPLAYLLTGIKKFANLQPGKARFSAGETVYEGPFLLFAVGNSGRTGGGNWLTPRANLRDAMLDLCVVKEMSRVDFAKLLPDLRAGSHLSHPAVLYVRASEIVVESAEEMRVNADGEPLAATRFEYRLSPHRIAFVAPPRISPTG